MTAQTRIMFVDDEPAYCRIFNSRFGRNPRFLVQTAGSGAEALTKLQEFSADIVLSDLKMPYMDGIELLTIIREKYPKTFVLILTGTDVTTEVVKAMKAGAYDYLLKPFDFVTVERTIGAILAHQAALHADLPAEGAQWQDYRFENIIGQDRKMFEVYEKINQLAQTDASVMITGESGTGKELIAAAVHAKSPRRDQPFIQVNCAALNEGVIHSELFGHEKGSFTGAIGRRRGFFEQASGGTIFLDEIGDIPMVTQVALLRVLEVGTFQRVGGTETVQVDVRLICATHQDLGLAIREKRFREDLYYRINVVNLQIPSLRDRRSDIPLLANYFLERFCAATGKSIGHLSRGATELLIAYHWPGNVRELSNIMERAVIFCRGREVMPEDLPEEMRQPELRCSGTSPNIHSTSLAAVEASLIRQVLEEKRWNLKQTAEALDIARGTLYGKMGKYGIIKPD